jgi:hypothetical protein
MDELICMRVDMASPRHQWSPQDSAMIDRRQQKYPEISIAYNRSNVTVVDDA